MGGILLRGLAQKMAPPPLIALAAGAGVQAAMKAEGLV
jgi:hypothetical protein